MPYLDGELRNEEFDATLVDAWGNDNPGYREIAALGRAIVPVMPSLLAATPMVKYQYDPEQKRLWSLFTNEFGRYLIVVNTDLAATNDIALPVLPQGTEHGYDLLTLTEISSDRVRLEPGSGTIRMFAAPEHFAVLEREIRTRQLRTEWELLQVDVFELRRAGFDTAKLEQAQQTLSESIHAGDFPAAVAQRDANRKQVEESKDANPTHRKMEAELMRIRTEFGCLNSYLTDFDRLTRIDGKPSPEWQREQAAIRQLSRDYFRLLRSWQHGDDSGLAEATSLREKVAQLAETILVRIP